MEDFLDMEALVKWDKSEAFGAAADYNALFKVDLSNGHCTYVRMFNEAFNKKRLFTKAVKVGDKIYFIPASADKIYVYIPKESNLYEICINPVNQRKYIFYKKNKKFNGAISVGKYLYITPCTYPGLLRINTQNDEVACFSDWVTDGDYVFRKAPILSDNIIYLPSVKNDKVLKFNTKEDMGQIISIQSESGGWWSMCKNSNCFWLSPWNPGPIICWDEKIGKIIEFDKYPNEFIGGLFYFTLCFSYKRKVYFLPAYSNMGIIIDTDCKKMYGWKIDYVDEDSEVLFINQLDNIIYIKIIKGEDIHYISIDCETLKSTKYSFIFNTKQKEFILDLRNKMKNDVVRERVSMNLCWFIDDIVW